jgi:hypothetical protein
LQWLRQSTEVGCISGKVYISHAGLFNILPPTRSYNSIAANKVENKDELSFYLPLSPWFVSGYVDGEGTFVTVIRKNAKHRSGFRVETVFRIGIHKRDLALLNQIQTYFFASHRNR